MSSMNVCLIPKHSYDKKGSACHIHSPLKLWYFRAVTGNEQNSAQAKYSWILPLPLHELLNTDVLGKRKVILTLLAWSINSQFPCNKWASPTKTPQKPKLKTRFCFFIQAQKKILTLCSFVLFWGKNHSYNDWTLQIKLKMKWN